MLKEDTSFNRNSTKTRGIHAFFGFPPILWLGGHFFQMSPRDVARGVLAKAGACLCRATGFSTIHCTRSLFTNRDASVLGMGRERNIPNVFYKIS